MVESGFQKFYFFSPLNLQRFNAFYKMISNQVPLSTVKIYKSGEVLVWWRRRDSLSHVSQWSDSQQNQGV